MRDWINGACDEVDRLTAQQPYDQELLAKRKSWNNAIWKSSALCLTQMQKS